MPGRFEPRCSKAGAYQEVQCHGDVCFCVNFEGAELPGTRQSIAMGKPICSSPGDGWNTSFAHFLCLHEGVRPRANVESRSRRIY